MFVVGVSDHRSQVCGKSGYILLALHYSADVLCFLLLEDLRSTAS